MTDNNNQNPTESRAAALARQTQEKEDFQRRLKESQTIDRVFLECPAKFKYSPDEVLKTLGTIKFVDGIPVVASTGVALSEALISTATVNPHLKAESLQEQHDPSSQIKSKADLKTVAEKSAYITMYGEAQYSRLPLSTPGEAETDPEKLSFAQYKSLPLSTRSKLSVSHPNLPARLMGRDQEQARYSRLVGIPNDGKKL